jgi:hypothetical protein
MGQTQDCAVGQRPLAIGQNRALAFKAPDFEKSRAKPIKFGIVEPIAGVAQLVEQLICNQPVASSSLVTSFLNLKSVL